MLNLSKGAAQRAAQSVMGMTPIRTSAIIDWKLQNRLASKVERAERHLFDLREQWAAFLESNPYPIRFEDDPQTGDRTYYVVSVAEIPDDPIKMIIGDAVHNLRSALDHIAHELVCIGKGSRGPFKWVYFPIAEDSAKYHSEKGAKVKGMRQDAIHAIDLIEPYGSGAFGLLWYLHQLDIIDKHRLLLAAACNVASHSM